MGLANVWKRYRVLIVMGTSLGLIHWSWFHLKGHPALHRNHQLKDDAYISEPAIVSHVASDPQSQRK